MSDATAPDPHDPFQVYLGLRQRALYAVPSGLLAPTARWAGLGGVVVDVPGSSGGIASLVALAEPAASLYTSGGGGFIGAGNHPDVAQAAQALVETVAASLEQFHAVLDDALPPPEVVRVHALGEQGRWLADLPRAVFWGEDRAHGLSPVAGRAQQLITRIREHSDQPG